MTDYLPNYWNLDVTLTNGHRHGFMFVDQADAEAVRDDIVAGMRHSSTREDRVIEGVRTVMLDATEQPHQKHARVEPSERVTVTFRSVFQESVTLHPENVVFLLLHSPTGLAAGYRFNIEQDQRLARIKAEVAGA
jgi:hypothetical protein